MQSQKTFSSLLVNIGFKLAELREQKGYSTIKDFVVTYDLPEIQYWRMEKGKSNITLKSLIKILNIHGVSVEEFFCMIPVTEKN
jgi:transcriptional regulator with XRE-family HTH domain